MTVWQDMNNALAQHSYDPFLRLRCAMSFGQTLPTPRVILFGRMFRWNYYDVTRDESQRVIGMFATRFNSRF